MVEIEGFSIFVDQWTLKELGAVTGGGFGAFFFLFGTITLSLEFVAVGLVTIGGTLYIYTILNFLGLV